MSRSSLLRFVLILCCCSFAWSQQLLAQCSNGGEAGGNTPACSAIVCALDSFCCATAWDSICEGEAKDDAAAGGPCCACVASPPAACGGSCGPQPGPVYCDDAAGWGGTGFPACPDCEAAVCGIDSFCCAVAWDGVCGGEAAGFPTECGDCLTPAPGTNCDDIDYSASPAEGGAGDACTAAVCAMDPFLLHHGLGRRLCRCSRDPRRLGWSMLRLPGGTGPQLHACVRAAARPDLLQRALRRSRVQFVHQLPGCRVRDRFLLLQYRMGWCLCG